MAVGVLRDSRLCGQQLVVAVGAGCVSVLLLTSLLLADYSRAPAPQHIVLTGNLVYHRAQEAVRRETTSDNKPALQKLLVGRSGAGVASDDEEQDYFDDDESGDDDNEEYEGDDGWEIEEHNTSILHSHFTRHTLSPNTTTYPHLNTVHNASKPEAAKIHPSFGASGINSLQSLYGINHVFYNRVPKCGSRTILRVIERTARKNHVFFHHSTIYNEKRICEKEQEKFIKQFMAKDTPQIFDRHLFFINFTRFGYPPPVQINLIRDPFERLLSRHYYVLYESRRTPVAIKQEFNMSFSECVRRRKPICTSPAILVDMLKYFCGQGPECESDNGRNNGGMLAQAKRHVVQHYAVVGVLEDLQGFFFALEKRLPRFFRGAPYIYGKTDQKYGQRYRNYKKEVPPDEIRELVMDLMAEEYDFYQFVLQRHRSMLQQYGYPKTSTETTDTGRH